MANRGEQELAREVDGLPVVVLVLVGVREQRDARALHALGRGVLARGLMHQGDGCEDDGDKQAEPREHRHEPPLAAGAEGRRVGAHVRVSEQLDAIEGLQRLARDRRVEKQPQPDVERPHLGKQRPAVASIVALIWR